MIDLIHGDIYEHIAKIPDKSVDLIIIDPPYDIPNFNCFHSKNFNRPFAKALNANNENLTKAFDFALLKEFWRIQPFLNAYIFCNAKLLQKLCAWYLEQGFTEIDILSYQKLNPIPSWNSHYNNDCEFILFVCEQKSSLDFGTFNPASRASHFYAGLCGIYKESKHPTEKPLPLIEKLLLNSSRENQLVLDCFMGSSTTALACKKHNRRFLGYEIKREFFEMAENRLKNGVDGSLFDL